MLKFLASLSCPSLYDTCVTTTTLLHSTSVFKVRTAGTGNEPVVTENLPTNNTNTETMLLSRS